MIDAQIVTFTLLALLVTLTPGADTLLVVRNVLRGTVRHGIVTSVGICSGLFFHAVLSALGVSLILMTSAKLYGLLKLAGALYLAWLGIQSLRTALQGRSRLQLDNPATKPRSLRRSFVEGVLSNVLNPKAVVFYMAFLPQFIHPQDPVLLKSLFLAGIHFTLAILWLSLLSLLLDRFRTFLLGSSLQRWIEGVCGTLLIALGVKLLLDRR
jgi:RhtB (resistance to homoserine/threonine) family protein